MFTPSQVDDDSGGQNKPIIPPPHIRSMVDKVVRFVGPTRPRLEKFFAKNAGMRKYRFMDAADPYHAYYQHRLFEFRAQNGSNDNTRPKPSPTDPNATVIEKIVKRFDSLEESFAMCDPVLVSPLTGELVTYNAMSGHIQDPKYKDQKERLFAKIRETTPAPHDDLISWCIIQVARTLPDIFATTEEEVCDAVKAKIERTNPAVLSDWPGRRRDDSLLVPEDEFLSQHPGPVCIYVWVPDKAKMLQISVESLSESVSSVKEKIAGQMEKAPPANKLKLSRRNAGFFKDSFSLAYYNIAGGVTLYLSW